MNSRTSLFLTGVQGRSTHTNLDLTFYHVLVARVLTGLVTDLFRSFTSVFANLKKKKLKDKELKGFFFFFFLMHSVCFSSICFFTHNFLILLLLQTITEYAFFQFLLLCLNLDEGFESVSSCSRVFYWVTSQYSSLESIYTMSRALYKHTLINSYSFPLQ